MFDVDGTIAAGIAFAPLAAHVWFAEMGTPWPNGSTVTPDLIRGPASSAGQGIGTPAQGRGDEGGDTPDTLRTISQHDFKLNAVFQTTRILVEIALCECPLKGGAKPGRLDLSPVVARAALLFEVGGWSDAMRWGMMKPELRITPLGDVHVQFDFLEHIVLPHAHVTSGGRIADAIGSYAQNLQDRPGEVTVEHRIDCHAADQPMLAGRLARHSDSGRSV